MDNDAPELYLPQPLTPFVGRRQELAEIENRLSEADCRLLTLLGPGGIGKTRLAIEVAYHWRNRGRQAVFADLQPVDDMAFLVPALLDSLNLRWQTQDDLRALLLHHLRDQELLLVLDNFEHLLEGAGLIAAIVQGAPRVKLLVTSRMVLNLQEEWLYPVVGLRFPRGDIEEERDGLDAYDAVQLFANHAHRVQPHFKLAAVEAEVVNLCRLVDGSPLALQLAGAWTRTLPVWAIADEVENDLTFLTTTLRNVPERHRSMQVVFDRSWQMLTTEERQVFKRLSVFRGSFTREAAAGVASASLSTLAALVDKSLLHREPDGRYQIHDLLRHFAADHLKRDESALVESYNAFIAYYARFLSSLSDDLMGGEQRPAMDKIVTELSTIRAAWVWAAAQDRLSTLQAMAPALGLFYRFQSRFQEGQQQIKTVAERLPAGPASPERDLTLVHTLLYVGWFLYHLGHLQESEAVWHESEALYRRLDIPPLPITATDPAIALSFISWIRGENVRAREYAEQALASSQTHNLPANEQAARFLLAHFYLFQHQPATAERYARHACRIARERGDRWFLGMALAALAEAVSAQEDTENARRFLAETYTIAEEFADYGGMAGAAHALANIALRQRDYPSALHHYRSSLELNGKVNDGHRETQLLNGLADTLFELGDVAQAAGYYRQAIESATAMNAIPLLLQILVGVSDLLRQSGRRLLGQDLLAAIAAHPGFDEQVETHMRARFQDDLPPFLRSANGPEHHRQASNLEQLLPLLLAELSLPIPSDEPALASLLADRQNLLEPLTARELEVMALIATGLTNRQIAEKLVIALSTVKSHIKSIYGKMGVSNRVQAVSRAQELRLL